MSKYSTLREYVQSNGSQSFKLTFEEVQNIAGIAIILTDNQPPLIFKNYQAVQKAQSVRNDLEQERHKQEFRKGITGIGTGETGLFFKLLS